jgi:hypothetical protein
MFQLKPPRGIACGTDQKNGSVLHFRQNAQIIYAKQQCIVS